MSDNEAEESEWSKEDLRKLFTALKKNGGQHDKIPYSKALKQVNWKKVAFPPFSAEACQRKWTKVLQTMQKTRTLKELIVEAENSLTSPPQTTKKPSPAHVIFYEENFAKFQKLNPKMNQQNLLVLIAKTYKELPDEEKARYQEKHRRASEEYNRLKLWKRGFTNNGRRAKQRKSIATNIPKGAEDDEGLPAKPPLNGYGLFCKEQVKSMAGVPKRSYVSVWAKRWRDLSEEQRKEYSARCQELKLDYMTKLNELLTPKRKWKFYGEPKMPAWSANAMYCRDQMKVLKEKIPNSRTRFLEINQRWSNLSTKEKLLYSGKLHESVKTYSVELQKWVKTLTPAKQQEYFACNPKKRKYLDFNQHEVDNIKEERCLNRTSDSEDEIIEVSSSDETEDSFVSAEEDSEEEDGDDTMFDMF